MKRWHLTTIFLAVFALTVIVRMYFPAKLSKVLISGGEESITDLRKPQRKVRNTLLDVRKEAHKIVMKKQKNKETSPKVTPKAVEKKTEPAPPKEARVETTPDTNTMFHYDSEEDGFVVHEVSSIPLSYFYSDNFIRLFRILDKSAEDSSYYDSDVYRHAYDEMEQSYSDVYLWAFLTNKWSKFNLFSYLLKKYSIDNKNWSPYKRDKADCTQYSERTYFFMYPGEILIKDQDYFEYLFSKEENILERTKHINKIPSMFYVRVKPFIFKNIFGEVDKEALVGHAMVAFKAVSGVGEVWIVGEPQNGKVVTLYELRDILPKRLKSESNYLTLGRILSVPPDPKREPSISEDLNAFMYYNNPHVKMDIVKKGSGKLLLRIKEYIESKGAESKNKIIKSIIYLLENKLQDGKEEKLRLIKLQEDTSSALNILIRELERLRPESSRNIVMKFYEALKYNAKKMGYMVEKDDMSSYIEQFKVIALSKLQYWQYPE